MNDESDGSFLHFSYEYFLPLKLRLSGFLLPSAAAINGYSFGHVLQSQCASRLRVHYVHQQ